MGTYNIVEIHIAFAWLVMRLVTSDRRQIANLIKIELNQWIRLFDNSNDYFSMHSQLDTYTTLRHKSFKMICQ
jgi:hypothetical protein